MKKQSCMLCGEQFDKLQRVKTTAQVELQSSGFLVGKVKINWPMCDDCAKPFNKEQQ